MILSRDFNRYLGLRREFSLSFVKLEGFVNILGFLLKFLKGYVLEVREI